MSDLFTETLQIVLSWEGNYGDHIKDPGGATNFGITRKTLSRWLGTRASKQQVRDLTMQDAEKIYKTYYWIPAYCDQLPNAIAITMFDCAVNQGVGRAKKLLQSTLRVKVDGIIGPKTLAAVEWADEERLLRDFMAKRVMHYAGLETLSTFGFGWFRRCFDVYGRALMHTKFINSRIR